MCHALLRRVAVSENEDSLELQIKPKAELRQRFHLMRHAGATGVASSPCITVCLHPTGHPETTGKASSDRIGPRC
jgi:hypothetical protein